MPTRSPSITDLLKLTGVSLTVYEEIVRSEQVVVLPLYFVTRWVRVLGNEPAWLVMAFRQMAFLNRASGTWFKVSGTQVAKLAALNPDTFWKYLREHKLLAWFVERDNGSPRWLIGADNRPHRDTNRYRVLRNIPLVPADQSHLRSWLKEHAPTPDAVGMLTAIRQALKTPTARLLAPTPVGGDPAAPAFHEDRPLSVEKIARQALPEVVYTGEVAETFASLCDDLYAHLVPRKDIVLISHYFIREWLPRLGHGLAWVVVYLRDRCFFDPEAGGKARDTIWINGGLRTLANLVGLKQSKTVGKWLRKKSTSQDDPWEVAQLVSVLERRKGFDRNAPQRVDIQVQVALREPLTQKDLSLYRRLLDESEDLADGKGAEPTHSGAGEGATPSHENKGRGGEPSHAGQGRDVKPTNKTGGEGVGPGYVPGGTGAGPTGGRGGSGQKTESQISLEALSRKFVGARNKNTEQQLLPSSSNPLPAMERQNTSEDVVVVDSSFSDNTWDLKSLLKAGRVPPDRRREVMAVRAPPDVYVSWYLFAATKKTIDSPPLFAASRFLDPDERDGAGPPFDNFAALGPAGVARCLYWVNRMKTDPQAHCVDGDRQMALAWREKFADRVTPQDLGLDRLVAQVTGQQAHASEVEVVDRAGEEKLETEEQQGSVPPAPAIASEGLDIPIPWVNASSLPGEGVRCMSPSKIWEAVMEELDRQLSNVALKAHLHSAALLDYEAGCFTVGVGDSYTRDLLESRLSSTIQRVLAGVVGEALEVRFVLAVW